MGLDMYLSRKTYVKNWDHNGPEKQHEVTIKRCGKVRTDIDPTKISYITEEVAYWRKANAIHAWFVANVQGGTDNCAEYYVSKDRIKELVSLCKQILDTVETVDDKVRNGMVMSKTGFEPILEDGKVIAQQEIAANILPTQSGFFFGSTDYDQYYLADLQDTVDQLQPLIDAEYAGTLYYQSSW